MAAVSAPAIDDLWRAFVLDIGPAEKILRTIVVYAGILLLVRLAGKRLLVQMNSLDLVVVLLLSNVVQNAIIGDDLSITGGLLGAATLVGVNAALDHATQRLPWLRRALEGGPTTVLADGKVLDKQLARLGMTDMELAFALRRQGASRVEDVHLAQLAPGGSIVVDLKYAEQPASKAELEAAVAQLKQFIVEHGRKAGPETPGDQPA